MFVCARARVVVVVVVVVRAGRMLKEAVCFRSACMDTRAPPDLRGVDGVVQAVLVEPRLPHAHASLRIY